VWLVPAGLGAGWLLWPCLDLEWKMEMGLAKDPEADMFKVQEMKNQRYEAKFGKRPDAKDDEEEDEEEESPEEEETSDEDAPEEESEVEEEEAGGNGDDDAGDKDEEGDDDDEDDEEESKLVVPPLYVPTKGKLSKEQVWDNYTIKV
jgi:hypothetical protein